MKCRAFSFHCLADFENEIKNFASWHQDHGCPRLYFQIHSSILSEKSIEPVWNVIERYFPGVPWLGNSTSGNIVNCDAAEEISVSAIYFEKPTTQFMIRQYDFQEKDVKEIAAQIVAESKANPWIKAIEIYHCISSFSTTAFCDGLDDLAPEIQVFGGIVCSPDITSSQSCVFSSVGGFSISGILILFWGGEDFYVEARKISGWKPIGRNFHVSHSKGNVIYKLGNVPAYEVYRKYLNIQNDENFFYNAIEFPMLYEHNGVSIVRAPAASNADGSLTMSSDVKEGAIVRLSYGEPQLILDSVRGESEKYADFSPEVLRIFSCAARKAFWIQHEPTYEILAFKDLAASTGFFSHGEFLREKGRLNQHNITLVIAAMREGDAGKKSSDKRNAVHLPENTRLPLAARMATFIRETSFELEQTNNQLRIMNAHLQDVATTDSLTGLENRFSFDSALNDIQRESAAKENWMLFLMDVNGLKYANDTFGHQAGDILIKAAADVILKTFSPDGKCYRIGGDEFAVVIEIPRESVFLLQEKLCKNIAEYNKDALYYLSIAVGDSRLQNDAGVRKSISDWKMEADLNMYRDKVRNHKSREKDENRNIKDLIMCLISVEEAKDVYMACHSERVSGYASLLARALGLSDDSVQMISYAANLHDIGKVGIGDAVLFKPGKLTDEEFSIIKQHPVIGAKILMQSNYTHELVQIVLHHHERYDGRGYPGKLAGEEIPIGSRILAIADSIDAMTSKRVYRDSMSLEYCRKEIERNLGVMYDPAIGKVALEHWDEIVDLLLKMRSGRSKIDENLV